MRKNMKLIGLAVSLTCCAGFINAQEAYEPQERQQQEKHLPRKVLNPEKVAIQMTEQMNKLLQLTDKQYKKIYKLNLKEQKAFFKAMQNSDDYRPPMGEGPGIRGGRPPMMGEDGFPGRMGGGPMMSRDTNSADSQKKAAETKEKKIKKILTKGQYEKWQTEQNSARKKASQRRMHKDNHPDKGPDFEQKNL